MGRDGSLAQASPSPPISSSSCLPNSAALLPAAQPPPHSEQLMGMPYLRSHGQMRLEKPLLTLHCLM